MATDLEAARLMVYNAARLKDAGQPFAQQAAMAKLFSSQVADRTTSNCLELFGGYGYSRGDLLSASGRMHRSPRPRVSSA